MGDSQKPIINAEVFRHSVLNWKLSTDVELLDYLKSFSEALINRTKEVEQHVETLAYDTKTMDVKLHNSFNRFLMLSNTQFVEQRIYDSEDPTIKQVDPEKAEGEKPKEEEEKKMTREQYEAQLVPKYADAIKFAVQLLEKTAPVASTAATATPDGADLDDDEPTAPILLQEEFDDRPLPLLIGTQDFDDDDNCGLYIEESDTESLAGEEIAGDQEGDHALLVDEASSESWESSSATDTDSESGSYTSSGSYSESEEEEAPKPAPAVKRGGPPPPPPPTMDSPDFTPAVPKFVPPPMPKSEESDGWSEDEEKPVISAPPSEEPEEPKPKAQADIRAQLNAMFGSRSAGPPPPTVVDELADALPEIPSAAEGKKKHHRHHKKGEKGEREHKHRHHKGHAEEAKKEAPAPSGLPFGIAPTRRAADEDDLFGEPDDEADGLFAAPKNTSYTTKAAPSSFQSDLNALERSMQAPAETKPEPVVNAKPKNPTMSALFGGDDSDIFGTSAPKEEIISPPAPTARKATAGLFDAGNLFGDDSDMFGASKPKPATEAPKPAAVTKPATQSTRAASSPFGDDGDLFAGVTVAPKVSAKPAGLFDGDSLFDTPAPVTTTAPAPKPAVVEEEEEAPAPVKPVVDQKQKSMAGMIAAEALKRNPMASRRAPLDDSDSDGDVKPAAVDKPIVADPLGLGDAPKASPKPVPVVAAPVIPVVAPKPAQKTAASLFGDDGDLFADAPSKPSPVVSKPAVVETQAKPKPISNPLGESDSLFGTTPPLFSAAPKPVVASPATKKPVSNTSSLFGDDSSDVFASKPSPKPAVTSSLFGDDSSDLFGGASAKPAPKPVAPVVEKPVEKKPEIIKPEMKAPAVDPLGASIDAAPSAPEGKQSVSALRNTLKLNPAMFMPGARPAPKPQPIVEDEPTPVKAESSTETTSSGTPAPVLGQITAGRARGPQRKPPTMRGISVDVAPTAHETPREHVAEPVKEIAKPVVKEPTPVSTPMFDPLSAPLTTKGGVSDPLAGILPVMAPKPTASGLNAAAIAQKAAASVLAAKTAGSTPPSLVKPITPVISSPTAAPKATVSIKPVVKASTNVDDIFGDIVAKKPATTTAPKATTTAAVAKPKPKIDDLDDIFSDPLEKKKIVPKTTAVKDIFDD